MAKSTTKTPSLEIQAGYWETLGIFVHMFAQIEKLIFATVIKASGVPTRVGQAMLSGQNLDQLCTTLKRALVARRYNAKARAEMDDIVQHLGPITRMRNDVLHFGTQFSSHYDYTVSNNHREHVRQRIRKVPVSVEILGQMCTDLDKIADHLMLHFLKIRPAKASGSNRLGDAWQYRPPSPKPHRQKRREHRAGQQRPAYRNSQLRASWS